MPFLLAPPPTPLAVWRLGTAALWAALAGAIAVTLAVAWAAPERLWLVPAGMAAVVGGGLLLARPTTSIYAAMALGVVALNKEAGLQANQVLYGLFAYAALGLWYLRRLGTGAPLVRSGLDRVMAVLVVWGFVGAAAVGVFMGSHPVNLRGDLIAFSMVLFYFPVKEVVRTEQRGPEVVLGIVIFIGAWVAFRNMLYFRETILAATQAWQIADARAGGGNALHEMQLLVGGLGALTVMVFARRIRVKVPMAALFALMSFALVMTRSRAYWVAFAVGVFALIVLLGKRRRTQLIGVLAGGLVSLGLLVAVFFGEVAGLIVEGTLTRLATFEAVGQDLSLLNRINESRAVLGRLAATPILGWGQGAHSIHFDLIYEGTLVYTFIHNGYLALWYKLGLPGLVLTLAAWGMAVREGAAVRGVADGLLPPLHRAAALWAAAALLATTLSAITSNPFSMRDQLFLFTVMVAVAAGLAQRRAATAAPLALPPA